MDASFWPAVQKILPYLIPIIILELILMVSALFDLAKQPALRGPKWAWVLIIIFVNLIGPIIYFLAARKEE